jgi:tetratricopeptide (TPR) repeat protein
MARKPITDPVTLQNKEAIQADLTLFHRYYLNAECRKLSERMLEKLAQFTPSPLRRGGSEAWAAGIIHAVVQINGLYDKTEKPYVPIKDIHGFFDITMATMNNRSKQIIEDYQNGLFGNSEFLIKKNRDAHREEMLSQLAIQLLQMQGLSMEEIMAEMPTKGFLRSSKTQTLDKNGEFMDADRDISMHFYEVMETNMSNKKRVKELEELIQQDPDFYDTYNALSDVYTELDDREKANACITEAFERGYARVVPGGTWPKHIEWGYLENRHILRIFTRYGIVCWKQGEIEKALELFRHILQVAPEDNVGIRYFILSIRLGISMDEFEDEVRHPEFSGYDGFKIFDWWDKNAPKFPEEFKEWEKIVAKMG